MHDLRCSQCVPPRAAPSQWASVLPPTLVLLLITRPDHAPCWLSGRQPRGRQTADAEQVVGHADEPGGLRRPC